MKIYKFIFLCIYLALVGCGKSGALYMPNKSPPNNIKAGQNFQPSTQQNSTQ